MKLSENLSQFKWFKRRGYDFKMFLAIPVPMVVSSDKTVNSYLNSPTVVGSSMGKDVLSLFDDTTLPKCGRNWTRQN
ncbi:MAG: hypothetical protein JJE08_08055 [Proteiniphilum sp.]|nr:hypothetical protein [Proteiniphilum sp.]